MTRRTAGSRGKQAKRKKVTRYEHREAHDGRTPETGHTGMINDEQVVGLPMDPWMEAVRVGELRGDPDASAVIVDFDPAVDPILFWARKRSFREVPLLPLQRNEVVTESRIARIIERARAAVDGSDGQQTLFVELERSLRESERDQRVAFYTHDEDWKNKLVCGDSLHVMESLLEYEGLRGKVQMVYIDPPYGVDYNSNFQQRIDSTRNDEKDRADDVLTIKAFRDTWTLGIHSYLSYLQERLYLTRELLSPTGSVFVQMGEDNVHLVRAVLDEVFGKGNFVSEIVFFKTSGKGGGGLDSVYDTLLWYAKDKASLKYRQLYRPRPPHTLAEQYTLVELADGTVRRITDTERSGAEPLPPGARRFMPDQLSSQGATEEGSKPFEFEGVEYQLPPNTHWKTSREGLERLASLGRIHAIGKRLRYKRYEDDFPYAPYSNVWDDTVISGFGAQKLYAVQTSPKVVERCIAMSTDPGDLVFDPTCGSGTTAVAAEKLGRRWIMCDTSRVALNIARQRILSSVFEHFRTRGGSPSSGFYYKTATRTTLKSLAYGMEPETIDLVDAPEVDPSALRVAGPFEVMSLGRYAIEDWKGFLVRGEQEGVENYISALCRLYRNDCVLPDLGGLIHGTIEHESLGLSVGPIAGRVTARQIHDAAVDAKKIGLTEVHVLGWAFEANVGEVTKAVEAEEDVAIRLVMIRPDSLVEGLKATQPEMLFSPLALPDVHVHERGDGRYAVSLEGVAVFDRKRRVAEYKKADGGYVSAWYLDEDYDGDCFVDCQMFFDFKKKPAIEKTLQIAVDDDEWELRLESQPFSPGRYGRIAVKVVDVYGNESTVVKNLAD